MRYAILNQGLITNVIEWDGEAAWQPPVGQTIQPDPDKLAEIGGTYDDQFHPAPLPEVEEE